MPSLSSYVIKLVLKVKGVKALFSEAPVNYQKVRKDDIRTPSKRLLRGGTSKQFQIEKTKITILTPKELKKTGYLLLYCPGGAFISGPNLLSWDSFSKLIKQTGITGWMVDYPKAPETKMLETNQNIDAVYAKALEEYDASKIILMGDSAGGNLILTLTQRLIKNGGASPQRLIAISPVLDCSLSNPEIEEVDRLDPMLSKKGILSAKKMCLGNESLKDPSASPLYGNFDHFPPVHLFMAENDIFYPDQKLGKDKMKAANVDLEVVFGEGMPHIWPLFPVMKEARIALARIGAIIDFS